MPKTYVSFQWPYDITLSFSQILAYLFRKKKHLLNSHILHLTYSLVGTIDSDRESTLIPHSIAFEDLLCDLEVGYLLCWTLWSSWVVYVIICYNPFPFKNVLHDLEVGGRSHEWHILICIITEYYWWKSKPYYLIWMKVKGEMDIFSSL